MSDLAKVTLRAAVTAGTFYPADPGALGDAVTKAFDAQSTASGPTPLAVISPHAGYRFSGDLAARAIAASAEADIQRVVVLSPSHRHSFTGLALTRADGYRMPGFDVGVDTQARDLLVARNLAHIEDAAHDQEHGIETQLPFLHHLHPKAQIVPLVIGRTDDADVARAVDALAGLDATPTLFVLSSDLSHFLSLAEAQAHDAETARLIETGKPDALTPAHACGMRAIRGFLTSTHGAGLRVRRLGMANSHRASRDPHRTVGYGAWGFYGTDGALFSEEDQADLLKAARAALGSFLAKSRVPEVKVSSFAPALQTHAAAFVTLQKAGQLRGCIGSLTAHRPLVADVVENAIKAAVKDPRFAPLQPAELDQITLKIAVLSPARPMSFSDQADLERQLSPGLDGLILSDQGRRGTFLPMVWDSLDSPAAFLAALKRKAGLPEGHWSDTLQIHRFRAESFGEAG